MGNSWRMCRTPEEGHNINVAGDFVLNEASIYPLETSFDPVTPHFLSML
jgi:hypothetical protein